MQSIQQTGAWRGHNRYSRDFVKLDVVKQVQVLVDELANFHLHKHKKLSNATVTARAYVCHQFLDTVRLAGFAIRNILNIDQRHIGAAVSSWGAAGLAASTIQTRMSILRWLAAAVGKKGLIMEPSFYGIDDAAVARTYVASEDKSWSAHDVISAAKVAEAMAIDVWVAHQLDLMRAFGLRINEAIMLRPAIADQGNMLRVEEGTKGGRTRNVPIRTEDQRRALDAAKLLATRTTRGSMCPPSLRVAQAKCRIYYVAGKRLGLRKADLGVTPHGLRHEYANDVYEEVSGSPSAVRGGSSILDRAADEKARHQVTQDLGHARLSITAAYTGPRIKGRPRNQPIAQAQSEPGA